MGGNSQQKHTIARKADNQLSAILSDDYDYIIHALMDNSPEALVVIDTAGCMLAFSASAERMFGYAVDEVVGRNVSMLMPDPHREEHDSYLAQYLTSGHKRIIGIGRHVMALHSNGESFPVELWVGEAKTSTQRVFFGFLRDTREEERQSRNLHELRSELAHALRVSSMGTLASAIAHEINQPLAAIQNYVETIANLAEGSAPVESSVLQEAMEGCKAETERASEIIRRLRQFLTTGEAERTHQSLKKLVIGGLTLALADGESAGLDLAIHLDDEADELLADGIQIEQVVFNLARNAVQAMAGASGKMIKISSHGHDAMVEVIVEDSGGGLDNLNEEQLFLPFFSTKPDGLGVGLSVCKTIIEAHGGRIWTARSGLGGAAFHFTLPRLVNLRDD